MRTAIYLRVSSSDQAEKFGLDVQRDRCHAMVDAKGWEVAATFSDEGLSGTLSVSKRPGMAALMKAASNGAIEAVIVAALDRLGRQASIILGIAEQLDNLEVELVSCRESLDTSTPTGQFVLAMFAGLAQLERDNIRQRTMDGSVKAVENGNVIISGANVPYGYDVAEENGNRTLVIDEAEAEVVRLMFRKYAHGEETVYGLAMHLTKLGIPKPYKSRGDNYKAVNRHRKWAIGSIAGMLANETYLGRWYYRKTKKVKQPDGSYRTVDRPRSEWIMVEVPAIIDEETFQAAQARRKSNKRQMAGRRKYSYALGGMLLCGHCGDISMSGITRHRKTKTMGMRTYRYYLCNCRHVPNRYPGRECTLPPVNLEDLEATVWNYISGLMLSPGKLRKEWKNYQEKAFAEMQPIVDIIEANEKRIAALKEEKRRLVKAYAEGVLSLDDIAADKTDIERTIEEYRKANEELRADLSQQVPDEAEFEIIEEFAEEMAFGAKEADDDPETQHDLYRSLHLSGVVTHENDQHFIDVTCVLGEKRLPVGSSAAHLPDIGRRC